MSYHRLRVVVLRLAGPWLLMPVALFSLSLVGCGNERKDRPASQVAAKVNREEISVHQVNHVMQRQTGLKPEQIAEASRHALERLIDQELVIQKASETRIERDPAVLQSLDVARREIVAHAYLDKLGERAPKASAEEIKNYYNERPELFGARRVYSFQELIIEAPASQAEPLEAKFKSTKSVAEFVSYLQDQEMRFESDQTVRAAEQLPLIHLRKIAQLKDGEAIVTPTPNGVQVIVLLNSRSQPVSEERARAPIEQFLTNERKRKLAEDEVKALRSSAKVEYVGEFAKASAPVESRTAATDGPPSSVLDLEKGLKGFK